MSTQPYSRSSVPSTVARWALVAVVSTAGAPDAGCLRSGLERRDSAGFALRQLVERLFDRPLAGRGDEPPDLSLLAAHRPGHLHHVAEPVRISYLVRCLWSEHASLWHGSTRREAARGQSSRNLSADCWNSGETQQSADSFR
jgi:hypothetical protein